MSAVLIVSGWWQSMGPTAQLLWTAVGAGLLGLVLSGRARVLMLAWVPIVLVALVAPRVAMALLLLQGLCMGWAMGEAR